MCRSHLSLPFRLMQLEPQEDFSHYNLTLTCESYKLTKENDVCTNNTYS